MVVDVVIEQRFYQCQEGKLWTNNAFPYEFWQRYLGVFVQVNIVARVLKTQVPEADWKQVDGQNVSFSPLPTYIGPVGFVKSLPKLFMALRARKKHSHAVIYRVPGILSFLYHYIALPAGQRYAAEVVGDPADVFAKGASKSMLRPIIKWMFVKMLKGQCSNASSIAYVTEFSLQQRYPPNDIAFHTHYSSIQLTQWDYKTRSSYQLSSPLKIICIGNLTQPYKGCDFMLQTLAQLHKRNIACELTWVGGGYLLESMQNLAQQLGVADGVNFLGNLSDRKDIRLQIDQADLFVLSSRQEGLPRVMIESMARSLVCVATNVGGVKELVPKEFIVESDNIEQMVSAIARITTMQPEQLLAISQQNYTKALQYDDGTLAQRRNDMYQHLLEAM